MQNSSQTRRVLSSMNVGNVVLGFNQHIAESFRFLYSCWFATLEEADRHCDLVKPPATTMYLWSSKKASISSHKEIFYYITLDIVATMAAAAELAG